MQRPAGVANEVEGGALELEVLAARRPAGFAKEVEEGGPPTSSYSLAPIWMGRSWDRSVGRKKEERGKLGMTGGSHVHISFASTCVA